ncbi:MAG: SDR family oxidoreductase, partial [Actinomycetospora chiangmaiensis]|nr:SDR family oxidoreductase [Actinomycetospora chiangmaiensis]
MTNTVLIVGASGIVGSAAAARFAAEGWRVAGLARRPATQEGVEPVAADLQDRASLEKALDGLAPSHLILATWQRRDTEAEMIRVNRAMVEGVLDVLRPQGSLRHAALVTGLKHYLGPFEAYGKGTLPQTPFREEQGRLPIENFYYAQEDALFAASERDGFSWSVHRPHTIIGKAVGNAMNMGTTLACYATLCRELNRPFVFPGSAAQWNGLTDMTDARLLARHLLWASTEPQAANLAFNVVNGDVFRWSWMWGRIAEWFGIAAAPFDGTHRPLEPQMAQDGPAWSAVADRYGLAEPDLTKLAS